MTKRIPKLITSKHYHLWTDALHARALARQSDNEWDRGAYVRWAVNTAWTAFEVVCEDVTGVSGLGIRFKERLNEALNSSGFTSLNWGEGIWQRISNLYEKRKDFTHIRILQEELFPDISIAEDAISLIREAIKAINIHTYKEPPQWVEDDSDIGWKGKLNFANLQRMVGGAQNLETGSVVRIAFVSKGKEIVTDFLPPWTPYEPYIQELIDGANVPISMFRVYHGDRLIDEFNVLIRGA